MMKATEQAITNYLILFLLLFLCLSCEKENKSELDILRSKTWKVGIVDKNTATSPNGRLLYNAVLECDKDDLYTFLQNGYLGINYGKERCENNKEQEIKYSYNKNSKKLTIDGTEYQVLEINKIQIKYCAELSPGTNYDYLIFLLQ
jgi:hypothetical protein